MTRTPTENLISPYICKKHRQWMKKGVCIACESERMLSLAKYKQERGIKEVPLKTMKL